MFNVCLILFLKMVFKFVSYFLNLLWDWLTIRDIILDLEWIKLCSEFLNIFQKRLYTLFIHSFLSHRFLVINFDRIIQIINLLEQILFISSIMRLILNLATTPGWLLHIFCYLILEFIDLTLMFIMLFNNPMLKLGQVLFNLIFIDFRDIQLFYRSEQLKQLEVLPLLMLFYVICIFHQFVFKLLQLI